MRHLSVHTSAFLTGYFLSSDYLPCCNGFNIPAQNRFQTTLFSAEKKHHPNFNRRELLFAIPASFVALPKRANAELIQFPCQNLRNRYHFMRAGQSKLEEQDLWGTNPLFLTNRVDNALSDIGMAQVEEACLVIEEAKLDLSIVKYPLAANAMDTADVISSRLHVGHNNLVPEYTYMDQRGIGNWDMQPLQTTEEAVWAMDSKEADYNGWGGLPPPINDGTANEMLGHQVTRLRQLLSLLESFASGDSILLIFPDGTGPALLSCLIAGIPLNRVHELQYEQGEVRTNVDYDSVHSMLPYNGVPSKEYQHAIQRGSEQLEILRSKSFVSRKDQIYAEEQMLLDEQESAWKAEQLKRQKIAEERRNHRYEAGPRQNKAQGFDNPENQKLYSVSTGVGDGTGFVAGAVGSIGLLAISNWGEKDKVDGTVQKSTIDELEILEKPINHTTPGTSSPTAAPPPPETIFPELVKMESLIEGDPIVIPELVASNEPVDETAERIELAEQAMTDYISQDDGSDAFLGLMDQLISED